MLTETMKTTAAILQYLIERFPHHWGRIRRLLQENESFRELCTDYSDCIEMRQRCQCLNTPTAQKRLQEYELLQHELEIEISNFLNKEDVHE